MDLFPHQEEAVQFLAARKAAGLFDDQGLGKTASTLRAAKAVGAQRVLVVAPASVLLNWRREAATWFPELLADEGLRVVSKDSIRNEARLAELCSTQWDVLIVDEAHFFKSPKAKRTKALYGKPSGTSGRVEPSLRRASERVWILTGTPMPNNHSELWVHLRHLAPERIAGPTGKPMNLFQFKERFCEIERTPYGDKIVGCKNAEDLRARLDGFYLRRLKGDVLDLPPIRWGIQTLEACPVNDPDFELPLETDGSVDLEALRKAEEFSTWRRLCGEAKAGAAASLLLDELEESSHKEVVFFHHEGVRQHLMAELARAGHGFVTIVGGMPADARQRAVDAFQTDPGVRVALCNIVAGGTGTTLTAAHRVTFVEQSFVPGENAQAADRCHRIGQTESVLARVLVAPGSVDELIADAITTKTRMIQETLR